MNLDQLKAAMSLHLIDRFATHSINYRKSVAEHSFRVALLYSYLGGTEVLSALTHDSEESVTGDIPSPTKKHLSGLESLEKHYRVNFQDPKEKDLCKLCDELELVLDLIEQQQSGNNSPKLMNIYDEALDSVREKAKQLNKLSEVKKLIKELGNR